MALFYRGLLARIPLCIAGFALLLSKLFFGSQARIYIDYRQLAALALTAAPACEPVQAERSAILDEWHAALERTLSILELSLSGNPNSQTTFSRSSLLSR